ncbi:hypothetical protein [Vibrio sp. 10N.222.54.B11]|uniref:hypothetical protein n=1 Tax=Vibrio sp. 10N.222.54.B11 TaxID=3229635 RepID=UPI00355279BD
MKKITLSIAMTLAISGCSSTPDWVFTPDKNQESGIWESACVADTGNFTTDRNHAAHQARVNIARSLETSIVALEQSRQATDSADNTYSSVSEQTTSALLKQSRLKESALVNINDQSQFCVLMELSDAQLVDVIDELADDGLIDPMDRSAMYEEFKKQQQLERLSSKL